jgi:hypothetical protein
MNVLFASRRLAAVCLAGSAAACSLPMGGLAAAELSGLDDAGGLDDAATPSPSGDGGTSYADGAPEAETPPDATGGSDAAPITQDGTIDDGAAGSDASSADASAAPDAPEGDARSSDAPSASPDTGVVSGGPSLCGNGAFLFCDGFEGTLSAWGTEFASGGQASIDTAHVFRGSHALHAHADAVHGNSMPFQEAYVDRVQQWPKTVFARLFAYIPAPYVPASAAGIFNVFQASEPYGGVELDLSAATHQLVFNGFNDPSLNGTSTSSTSVALDAWHCLEMEIDGASSWFRAFLDGVELTDLSHALAGPVPTLGILQVGLGFSAASMQPAYDMWVDEVAVDASRIGCDR